MNRCLRHALLVFSALTAACSLAPPYVRPPPMPLPLTYKEVGHWVENKPDLDKLVAKGPWWEMFQDSLLNRLEQKLHCYNNNLKVAWDQFQKARAFAEVTASALYPNIQAISTVARQRNSISLTPDANHLTNNTFLLASILNYEIDAWGRVRNSVIASDSEARASSFDLAAIALSLHAELASDYFQLRGLDEAQRVLDANVAAYQKSLYLIRKRHSGGMVAAADVDAAIAQWENARTRATENRLKRARFEHAIAVLVGEFPEHFCIKGNNEPMHLATVSPQLPSTLLKRRPDIAAASTRVCAANAQIGVARAAFFPQFNLFTLLGFESNRLSRLFRKSSLLWSLGPSTALSLIQSEISQFIFDGFKRRGMLRLANAQYFETVDRYRQTVLEAFREVEDALIAIRRIDEAYATQKASTAAARRALYQANQQYLGGLVTYIDVVVYENLALQSELALISLKTRRQLASVQLIRALGGGFR